MTRGVPTPCPHGFPSHRACRTCTLEDARARAYRNYWADPEKYRKRTSQWQKNNPEKVREKNRQWQKDHPEKVREYARGYYRDDPEKHRQMGVDYHRRRTHLPLVGPLAKYAGERTQLDCPHCGETNLIDTELRPLTCPACGQRVKKSDIFLFAPIPYDFEKHQQSNRAFYARMRVNDPERYKAHLRKSTERHAARRRAMNARDGRLSDPKPVTDDWFTPTPSNPEGEHPMTTMTNVEYREWRSNTSEQGGAPHHWCSNCEQCEFAGSYCSRCLTGAYDLVAHVHTRDGATCLSGRSTRPTEHVAGVYSHPPAAGSEQPVEWVA